ncbi:protein TRIGALACTOSYLDIACYLGLYCEROL 4, chloroplastic-like isoform X1 [Camellia sinensis]|uniref:protein TRIGALACTOSYLDIACYLGLYCEROL 4, chloroplastic-like isoform X1 n=1 Tax=Camellia sinensis TaxID=4442 RepID=UPI0010362F28|nr:protein TRIGALACTOSYLDIACYLGLYCEROL 4, chloroplastic-like isoform X1 [Camellia sinensis]
MANLRTAMDSGFWDLNIATPQSLLEGSARCVPGEPFPLDGARASRALRIQQLSLLGNGFPLGIIPSFSPTSPKELGSFCLQSLFLNQDFSNWWLGLVAQLRPKKLISAIKSELYSSDEWELPAFKDVAKHFLDKSLYSIGLCSQISLNSSSSLLLSTEAQGEKKGRRTRAMLLHKLPNHDLTMEVAWPQLYIDHNGKYWDVPESISLDCSSLVSESGFRYRFGLHQNSGNPRAVNPSHGDVPLALLPGFCAKAAFSYEKGKDLWRQMETKKDVIIETEEGRFWRPAYDIRLKEPHAVISGIIGGTCAAWIGGRERSAAVEMKEIGDSISISAKKISPFSADLFGSVCYTFQHGKFRKLFGDLSRVDARLDICSASALAQRVSKIFKGSSLSNAENPLSSPRLNLILQQQVAGPIVFRVDSKFLIDSSSGKQGMHMEDLIYSLNYSLRLLQSGKVVAWYSPKRKEAMIELRLFEF